MWKEGNLILFECKVEETGKPCLTGGWIRLSEEGGEKEDSSSMQSAKSDAIFEAMGRKISPDLVPKVNAIFRWVITDDKKAAIAQWGKFIQDTYWKTV